MGQDISISEVTGIEIIEGLKSDDDTLKNWAAEQLIEKYDKRLQTFIRRKGATDFEIEDILMETFERFIEKIEIYDPDKGASLFTWLCQIGENRRIDRYRKSHAQKRPQITDSVDIDAECFPSEKVTNYGIRSELEMDNNSPPKSQTPKEQAFHSALGKLHPNYRKVLILRYLTFNSSGEVAAFLDKSENAVNMQLTRAKKQLRNLLAQYPEFSDYFETCDR